MSEIRIASRYAKALLDLGTEEQKLDFLFSEVSFFVSVLRENTVLQAVLKNPVIHGEKKIQILQSIFKNGIGEVLSGFFRIMIKKGRAEALYATAQEFLKQYNQQKDIVSATVTSASPLSDTVIAELVEKVKVYASAAEVQLVQVVDPTLIGGFILKIGDRQIDASVAGKLNKLELTLESR